MPIESEVPNSDEEAPHGSWVDAKVKRSPANSGALVPHDVVMRRMRETIARLQRVQHPLG